MPIEYTFDIMIRNNIHIIALFIAGFPVLGGTNAVLDIEKLPPQGQTLVWSPLFQASWDKLNAMHGGVPEKVVPPNKLISRLDQFQWRMDEVMPKDGYATFAGPTTQEFAQATAVKIKKQFGVEMTPSNATAVPGGVSLYGILVRDLSFQKGFFRSRKNPLSFKDGTGATHDVKFFGTIGRHSGKYGNSVKVLDYKPLKKSFILSIVTDRVDETLIIYRPDLAMSFGKAIQQVAGAIKVPFDGPYGSLTDGTLHKNDTVKIPYLTLNANTFFTSQLKGARFYAGENQPWQIAQAYQITNFELFEKGARIRVETRVDDGPFGGPPPPPPRRVTYVPRNFVCDEPFFVFVWREGAPWPYFSAWIDGDAALNTFSPK